MAGVQEKEGSDKEKAGSDKEWITPSKTGRSPGKFSEGLKPSAGAILSNTYSVLGEEDGVFEEPMQVETASIPSTVVIPPKEVPDPAVMGETWVREKNAKRIGDKVFKDWSVLMNYEFNRRGRLWIVWSNKVRMTPFYKSEQLITCSIKLEDQPEEFFCSFVYALNTGEQHKVLWQELKDHADSPIINSKPLVLMGDFNETLDMAEHSRVADHPMVTSGMRDFQDVVGYCSLTDLASNGPLFTWWNKQDQDPIMKKLDRVMVNDMWLQRFPRAYNVFEAGGCSDHLRSKLHMQSDDNTKKHRPFKFANVLTEMDEFWPMVDTYWQTTQPLFLSTSTLFRFHKKIEGIKAIGSAIGER
ncbi:PREDICTED: uncharacterized protein LOC104704256 [Camelina sativa]|uniref:Uncharacterized protein LOC104704256 n=1 Tax=Camelina sativa TaxID=90675 RepID=A0ABM0T033_CAMSA|nr:PREDICTED: uncharacterized protein LOC104704256 [Camelina sativa]